LHDYLQIMKQKPAKIPQSRIRTSYATTVISVSLVLFLIGLGGLLLLNAAKISAYVKENIGFSVILKENVKDVEMHRVQKELDAMPFVKSTNFVSRDEAAEVLQKELGEEFISFLGYNPLLSSIDVKFYAEYANPDSVAVIEYKLRDFQQIKEIYYQKSLVHLVDENVKKIGFILFVFSALLMLIAVALINNTIRLSIYSKRFIIRTMQLVGATKGFIRSPFVYRSAVQGIISALIALCILSGFIYVAQKEFVEIASSQDFELIGILYITVVIVGIIISSISTYFAVNRFLNLHSDDLYI